ncbi:MAG: hypothetical protein AAGA60_28570, partial [Cyanobacteria bacterium P01_E01_bin.42]
MTSVTTFEFSTAMDIDRVTQKLSELWYDGRKVDMLKPGWEGKENVYLCVLEYMFFTPEEEPMIRDVVNYLLSIAEGNKIFYYRDFDIIDFCKHDEPIEITIDDLFTPEFRPCMSG